MNTVKRSFIKVAVVANLAVGIVGLPMAVSAEGEPNEMSCQGLWMNPIRQGYTGQTWTPHLHAEAFGGTPGDLSWYVHNIYCGQYFIQD